MYNSFFQSAKLNIIQFYLLLQKRTIQDTQATSVRTLAAEEIITILLIIIATGTNRSL